MMKSNQQLTSFFSDYVKKMTEINSLSTPKLIYNLILQKQGNKFIFSHFISTDLVHMHAFVLLLWS
jgi:hypothetical protein